MTLLSSKYNTSWAPGDVVALQRTLTQRWQRKQLPCLFFHSTDKSLLSSMFSVVLFVATVSSVEIDARLAMSRVVSTVR